MVKMVPLVVSIYRLDKKIPQASYEVRILFTRARSLKTLSST